MTAVESRSPTRGSNKRGRDGASISDTQRFTQLCHIVSLRRSGKSRSVVDSVVETVFVVEGSAGFATAQEVVDALKAFFEIDVEPDDVQRSLDAHVRSGKLLADAAGVLRPSSSLTAEIGTRIQEAEALEQEVRDTWAGELVAAGIADERQINDLWGCLRSYMGQVFRVHGALALQLLDPGATAPDAEAASREASLEKALSNLSCEQGVGRAAVSSFFNTMNPSRARYVAQLADGTFSFMALSVHEGTAEFIRSSLKPLKLFLDTNVIFDLLGLHSHATGDSCQELVDVIKANQLPFKLYYHEETLDEIRRTIGGIGKRLRSRASWSQNISRAAISQRVLGKLSTVELRYHELNAKRPLDPALFLSKYEHVETILEDFGLILYREPERPGYTVERKGKLIAEYEAFVAERRPNEPKPYEALNHDMAVWLAVDRMRSGSSTSALQSGALFVSNDFLLHKFDWTKLRKRNSGAVVLPTQLLQVLRPMVRSDADFDARFVQTFAVPEFRTVHSDYGRVTSDVLSLLDSYNDVAPETAVRILTDEAFLRELREVDESDPQFRELVDSAIARDNEALLEETEALRRDQARLKAEADAAVAARDAEIAAARAAAEAATAEGVAAAERARSDERSRAEAEAEELRRRIQSGDEALETRTSELERQLSSNSLTIRILVAVLMVAGGCFLIGVLPLLTNWKWLEGHDHRVGLYLMSSLFWVGLTGAVMWREYWRWMLGTAALGALLTIGQIV